MSTSDEVNAFLRDERAWRRAAQRPMEDDVHCAASMCGHEANWSMFRRGTSDNAFTLKFANSLRATALTDSPNTTSSHTRSTVPRKRWNANARCAAGGVAPDPLQQMLVRNLQRGRSPPVRARSQTRSASAFRYRERCRAVERVNREFMELEAVARREIVAASKVHWKAMTSSFFHDASALLLLAELHDRRVLFRAWQEEKYRLAAAMSCEKGCLTNMTSRQFKQHCQLIQVESLRRNRIVHDEKECRDLLGRFAYVEYLKALEAEIESCKRRELRLLRRIA